VTFFFPSFYILGQVSQTSFPAITRVACATDPSVNRIAVPNVNRTLMIELFVGEKVILHSKLISSYQNDSEFIISTTLGLKIIEFPSPRKILLIMRAFQQYQELSPLIPHESLWPSVIRWKLVFSSNWKNIKNRRGGGGGTKHC